jgi:hypothetical protein
MQNLNSLSYPFNTYCSANVPGIDELLDLSKSAVVFLSQSQRLPHEICNITFIDRVGWCIILCTTAT